MNVLIASYNLIPEKSHLMPWRYVCEAASYFNKNGHQAIVVSIADENGDFRLDKEDILVRSVRRAKGFLQTDISDLINEYDIDVIFWPVSWREKKYRLQALGGTAKPVVGYFPGGIYSIKNVIYSVKSIGLRASLPYILEAIIPKARQLRLFRSNGIKEIIALTEWTSECIQHNGWSNNHVVATLPGKEDGSHSDVGILADEFTDWLSGSDYLVFMGPPTAIRGGYELLKAFDKAADENSTIRLVCLFRSDVGVDQGKMKSFISTLNNSDRLYVIWESLDRKQLESFISNAYAIALPFVIVPSEIPLAMIDAASYGKPVLTTDCGGSGRFAEQFGVTVDISDTQDFKENILRLFEDETFYLQKCNASKSVYQNHPGWADMSQAWLDVAAKAIAYREK